MLEDKLDNINNSILNLDSMLRNSLNNEKFNFNKNDFYIFTNVFGEELTKKILIFLFFCNRPSLSILSTDYLLNLSYLDTLLLLEQLLKEIKNILKDNPYKYLALQLYEFMEMNFNSKKHNLMKECKNSCNPDQSYVNSLSEKKYIKDLNGKNMPTCKFKLECLELKS